jgi:hypothetical protein
MAGVPSPPSLPDGGRTFSRQLLALPYVDGALMIRFWNEIEADAGQYDWTLLDADLGAIADAGKKAELAVGAGMNSPDWVCAPGSGVQCLPLVYEQQLGPTFGPCDNTALPLPWDAKYLTDFDAFLAVLSAHVAAAGFGGTVETIKITGINEKTFETILPVNPGRWMSCDGGSACSADGGCYETDVKAALLDAGYDGPHMAQAYLALSRSFRRRFPGLPIGASASSALPASPDTTDIATLLIRTAVDDASELSPMTVQDNGLGATRVGQTPGEDPGTLYARDAGIPVGYQMLAQVFGANPCSMGYGLDGGCTEAVLFAAIDHGIDAGARWLEIFNQDLLHFPDAGAYAHQRLLGP